VKISELAKKAKIPSKMLLVQIVKLGISAKSAQSSIPEEDLEKVLKMLAKKKPSLNIKEIREAESKKPKKKTAAKKTVAKKTTTKKTVAKKTVAKKTTTKKAVVKKEKPKDQKAKEETKPKTKKTDLEAQKGPMQKESIEPKAKEPVAEESKEETLAQEKQLKSIQVKLPITVKDLAEKISIGAGLIIKTLMGMNILANINQLIAEEEASAVAEKFGYSLDRLPTAEEEMIAEHQEQEREEDLKPRSPVVTFMGHVDHGKTSLLDHIRKSKVTDQETGGITQHIGAYQVSLQKGNITFLDTPGHEAFTSMRARGANATDIVVLVVAADDGIMPQTVEAIDHARAAGVPIIVAINKVDKQNVDIDNVKKQLSEADLMTEDWGGKTIAVNVSAKTGEGVDNLLEMILLESEMLELKANPNRGAKGIVVEAHLSKGGGPVATVLVQNGTLKQGDIVIAGQYSGKIRALIDDRIHRAKEAPPSMPVEILGLNGLPQAGDTFMVVLDEKKAKDICDVRAQKAKDEKAQPAARKVTLEDLYSEIQKGQLKELNIILKADVRGSLEAVSDSLLKITSKNITLNIIHKGIGDINESDILLAAASNAIIIGFHVRKTPEADTTSKNEKVDIRLYSIIYEAIADIKAAMEGLLEPDIKEVFCARISVKQVFKLTKHGIIAGSIVQKGKATRNMSCRLIRNGEEIYRGKVSSLKRFKDDVKEVAEGYECGVGLENFQQLNAGDIIECYTIEKIAKRL